MEGKAQASLTKEQNLASKTDGNPEGTMLGRGITYPCTKERCLPEHRLSAGVRCSLIDDRAHWLPGKDI